MGRLFECEQGTPIESYYLESSAWPLRFIIMARKFMFYWSMLRKNQIELVKQVFVTQGQFPSKKNDDWVSEVRGEMQCCNINYTDEEIKGLSEFKFKRIIKEQIQLKVMAYLFALQNKHSKSAKLIHQTKMHDYLKSNGISTTYKKLLFRLRSKMLKIKANFSSMYKNNLQCSLCEQTDTIENEQHLLGCSFLTNHPSLKDDIGHVKFEDVFSNEDKQLKAAKVFKQIMIVYEKKRKQ